MRDGHSDAAHRSIATCARSSARAAVAGRVRRASGEHAKPGAHGHAEAPTRTLAVVERMTRDDLRACAGRVAGVARRRPGDAAARRRARVRAIARRLSARVRRDPRRSRRRRRARIRSPACGVDPADLRRACEVQARSHLLHLREGYLETRGRADALADLIVQSAPAVCRAAAKRRPARRAASRRRVRPPATSERTLGVPGGAITDIVAADRRPRVAVRRRRHVCSRRTWTRSSSSWRTSMAGAAA